MLSAGTRLGQYEIQSPIGAGGMGEVYRASDTKLHRDVAVKVLPENFARDAERVARFRREAQLLASLSHPNVATIHGLEEAEGLQFLVMELVGGETLAQWISRGAIPVKETLDLGRQIAIALEAAHEKGIVHRDLKPANIKVTPEGQVKVLDFGLAKALVDDSTQADLMNSPTVTAMATKAGVIVGTAAYMTPEQLRGKAVDRRADVWAFGCVLYEMLTGRQAFAGETVSDVIAGILQREVDWTALPAGTPPALLRLLRRCLQKDRRERLHDIADARLEIADILREPFLQTTPPAKIGPLRWVIIALIAGVMLGVLGLSWFGWWRQPGATDQARPFPPSAVHSTIELPAEAPLTLGARVPAIGFDSPVVTLAPNGSHLVYVGRPDGETKLFLREMKSLKTTLVPGTEGATYAFFSPDGNWLGFLTNDKVKKISLRGGAPVTLCDARVPLRAFWMPDDTIYFTEFLRGVSRVSAQGGNSEQIMKGGSTHLFGFTQILPGAKWALATVSDRGISRDYAGVSLVSLENSDTKRLVESGYDARYVAPGYLLFARAGSLMAARFDLDRLALASEPTPIATGVSMESLFGQAHVAISDTGLLAYVPGADRAVGRLAWVGRRGGTEFLDVPARVYGVFDVSPGDDRLAVHVADVADYIWIYDLQRREGRKLRLAENAGWPVWSTDGLKLAFVSGWNYRREVPWKILIGSTEGAGEPQYVASVTGPSHVSSWSPDGLALAITWWAQQPRVGVVRIGREVEWKESGFMPHFSPDGRFLSYSADGEIWVTSYPDANLRRQISTDGGIEPFWCPCGELFYRNGNQWMSVQISTKPQLVWTPPRLAFETDFIDTPGRSFAVSADGQRLLVLQRAEPDIRTKLHLIWNWYVLLESTQEAK